MNAPTPQEQFLPGLALPATETFADWQQLGRRLCMGARTINWLIGDWLIEGSERFGRQALEEANAILRNDVERLSPIVDTCRAFPEGERHQSLTFGHHLAVMEKVKDHMVPMTEAHDLLAKAETERMTQAALRAEVKVIRSHARLPLEDDDPVDTEMRRIVQAWNLASRAARQEFIEMAKESHMGVIEL